jgi:methionyl-tRNA synthetase
MSATNTEKNLGLADQISIDDFFKSDLRVAQILSATPIEKSKKLLKLHVSLGSVLGERQIMAGIAKSFSPEELVNKKIVIVANLAPATLAGEVSEGMLIATTDPEGKVCPLDPGADSIVGSRVG